MASTEKEERILNFLAHHEGAMGSIGPHIEDGLFDSDSLRGMWKVMKLVWERTKRLPTEREMVSILRRHFRREDKAWVGMVAARVKQVYRLGTTQATYAELVDFVAGKELLALATEVSTTKEPARALAMAKERLERIGPLLSLESDEAVMPMDPRYLREQLRQFELGEDRRQKVVPTYYHRLDEVLEYNGFVRGDMVLLFGRTGIGKSFAACSLTKNWISEGHRVLYCNFDNQISDIEDRVYANLLSLRRGRDSSLSYRTKSLLKWMEANEFDPSLFHVKDFEPQSTTIEGISHHISKIEDKYGKVDVVVVDYMDQVKSLKKAEAERHGLRDTSERCRGLAKRHDLLVLALSQGNVEGAKQATTRLYHGAEGWSKAWAASQVLTLSQTAEERNLKPSAFRWGLVKNRGGVSDLLFPFNMHWEFARFVENVGLPVIDIDAAELEERRDKKEEFRSKKEKDFHEEREKRPIVRRKRTAILDEIS